MSVFVISDVHGNYEGLIKSLRKAGIIDKHGNRQLSRKHKVISIGDLANCVDDSVEGDHACLDLIPNVIDYLIIGNHEIPYFDSNNSFSGFKHFERMHERLWELNSMERIVPCVVSRETLISHAGISKRILSFPLTAREIWKIADEHWRQFDFLHGWFSSIGFSRGGRNMCGGMLWCDFDDEFVATDFPQIVGHTSRNPRVQMKDNAICIDVGAKDPKANKPFILEVK